MDQGYVMVFDFYLMTFVTANTKLLKRCFHNMFVTISPVGGSQWVGLKLVLCPQ